MQSDPGWPQPPPPPEEPSDLGTIVDAVKGFFGARPEPAKKAYRQGVLFVHGIGEQQRGDTLTDMGDALISWFDRVLETEPEPIGDVRIWDATLRQADQDSVGIAHLSVRVTLTGFEDQPSDWLLAESWWADAFRPPSFAEFASWGVAVGPWVAVTQFLSLSARLSIPDRLPFGIAFLVWVAAVATLAVLLLASLALSLFLTLLAIALTILRLVPIGFVQSLAVMLQRPLLGGFGDAFVLVRSEGRFAAMVARVRHDLARMLELCEEVTVVAHSQGTQVAWSAIRRPDRDHKGVPPGMVRFVTFGQALAKLKLLHWLSHLELTRSRFLSLLVVAAAQLALLVIGAELVYRLFNDGAAWLPTWASLGVLAIFAVAETITLSLGMRRWREAMLDLDSQLTDVVSKSWVWHDYWASADPFPNGPLTPTTEGRIATWRVRNFGSVVLDHTTYWRNLTEFVTAVARDLGRRAFPAHPLFALPDAERRHARAAMRRSARVQVRTALSVAWVLTVAAFIPVGIVLLGPDLATSLQEPLADASEWFLIGPLIGWVAPFAPVLVSAAVVIAIGYVLWMFPILWAWGVGVRADDRSFFAARDEGLFPWPSVWGPGFLLAILIGGPVILWFIGPSPLWWALPMLAIPIILIVWVVLSAGGRRIGQADPGHPKPILSGSLFPMLVLIGFVLGVLVWHLSGGDQLLPVVMLIGYAAVVLSLVVAALIVFARFRSDFQSRS
ncbi:MAG TPA: hypothetical protein VFW95_11105 [Candidatus Limnocylindria bacterium]|nr:hypothetical protein [Candidatus Limnocylindria bacterium]